MSITVIILERPGRTEIIFVGYKSPEELMIRKALAQIDRCLAISGTKV